MRIITSQGHLPLLSSLTTILKLRSSDVPKTKHVINVFIICRDSHINPTQPFRIIPSKHRRGSVSLLKLSAGVNLHQSRTFEKPFANIVKKSDRTNFFPKKYNKRKHCHICNNRLTNNESTKKCGRLSATPPIICHACCPA